MIKTAILMTGYAETASRSVLILTHYKGFKTRKLATAHLSRTFHYAFDRVNKDRLAQLKELPAQNPFAKALRNDLKQTRAEFIRSYMEGDPQDGLDECWQALESHGWRSWLPQTIKTNFVIENADLELSQDLPTMVHMLTTAK